MNLPLLTKERKFLAGERRTLEVKFHPATAEDVHKLLGDTTELPDGYVAGWASTADIDHIGDKVMPGAFDKAISEKGLNGPKGIKLLNQHRSDQPAGVIEKLEQRTGGLWIEAQLNLAISYVKDMYEAAKMNGGLNFSIGYRLVEGGFDFVEDKMHPENSYWKLSEVDLHEVSVVTFPCNEEAKMTYIKGITDEEAFDTIAELEKALVASGLVKSRNDAQRVTRAVKRNTALFQHQEAPVEATLEALDTASGQLAKLRDILKTDL